MSRLTLTSLTQSLANMFGNRPMRAVAAKNSGAIALDDDAIVNNVEITIQHAQAITQGTLEPAAADSTSTRARV